ncbi:MAG: acetylglutamate kinase [Gemmatimonadota bacterium]
MAAQVIKIGGAALSDPTWLNRFALQARGDTERIIVHGGGPEVSALSSQLGLEVVWNGGRRVTSEAALDVAAMVLSGRINKRIVRALCAAGVQAIGISGEDAALLTARVAQDGALGRVGEIVSVRINVLAQLAAAGLLPVISPISTGTDGSPLNVNADEVAAAVANAVGAEELLFLTDVDAVRDSHGDRDQLDTIEARALIANQIATGGMAVKLSAAVAAVEAGVARVRVGSLDMMNDSNAGTSIHREGAIACQ